MRFKKIYLLLFVLFCVLCFSVIIRPKKEDNLKLTIDVINKTLYGKVDTSPEYYFLSDFIKWCQEKYHTGSFDSANCPCLRDDINKQFPINQSEPTWIELETLNRKYLPG